MEKRVTHTYIICIHIQNPSWASIYLVNNPSTNPLWSYLIALDLILFSLVSPCLSYPTLSYPRHPIFSYLTSSVLYKYCILSYSYPFLSYSIYLNKYYLIVPYLVLSSLTQSYLSCYIGLFYPILCYLFLILSNLFYIVHLILSCLCCLIWSYLTLSYPVLSLATVSFLCLYTHWIYLVYLTHPVLPIYPPIYSSILAIHPFISIIFFNMYIHRAKAWGSPELQGTFSLAVY